MTKEPDDRVRQYTELIRRLFEEAMKTGDMLPGEVNIIIAAASVPNELDMEIKMGSEEPVIREPVSEQHEHDRIVTITVDLPGTSSEDIRFAMYGGVLYLIAHAENVTYRAAYLIEGAATDTLTHTYKNGVIEFTYKKEDLGDGEVHPDEET